MLTAWHLHSVSPQWSRTQLDGSPTVELVVVGKVFASVALTASVTKLRNGWHSLDNILTFAGAWTLFMETGSLLGRPAGTAARATSLATELELEALGSTRSAVFLFGKVTARRI